MLKSVVRAVGAAVRLPSAATATARALPLSCPTLRSPSTATTRPFTRSLWMLTNNGASSGYRPKLFSSKVLNPSVSCGCGGLHTEGNVNLFHDYLAITNNHVSCIRQTCIKTRDRQTQIKLTLLRASSVVHMQHPPALKSWYSPWRTWPKAVTGKGEKLIIC